MEMKELRKESMYKTLRFDGQFAEILEWYADGPRYAVYKIRTMKGDVALVHSTECSDFCL